MGKNKPIWDPSTDCGDYVVAVGCSDLHTTGKKRQQKLYYTHTTRPGSLKSMSMDKMFDKWGGGEVLKRAVSGMLPKNRLRDKRLARLKVFEGVDHPYRKNIVRINGVIQRSGLPSPTASKVLDAVAANTAAKESLTASKSEVSA